MIREIVQLGAPVLRGRAIEVQDCNSIEIKELVRDLIETMDAAGGVGIAAPQVGIGRRIFVVASRPNDRYPNAPLIKATAMINPELEWASEETAKDWEGCLSIPGIRALVPRPVAVRVRYVNAQTGSEERVEYEGFIARVWQHEYDHLEGTVFLDRVSPKDIVTEKEYLRIIKKS